VKFSVLVVDDYEPWRRRVAAELEKSGRWRVVCECEDGGDAVREAAARPHDLIILDIGLKTMNGVEAARRILAADPSARILFLTGQQSPDVAEAVLTAGARGYLLKPEAAGGLMRAVEAIAAGARYVSPGLPHDLVDAVTPAPDGHRHNAVFRSTDAALADEYARFVENALGRGQPVLAVAPRGCFDRMHARLEARGVPVSRAIDSGLYRPVDVDAELASLMPNGRYDRQRFLECAAMLLGHAHRKAAESGQRPAVCGEMAPQLWKQGRGDVAVDIERLWDEAAAATRADLLCGYCVDATRLADGAYSVFREICGAHGTTHVR
jgi:DNA-binding NarL/FixJ family response regulator